MDHLWAVGEPLSVRQVHAALADRDLAYTTVMTVLDRLARKDVVTREREGRAWIYRAAHSRADLTAELMRTALDAEEQERGAALVAFVDRVSADEAEVLRAALARIEGKGDGGNAGG